MKPILRAEAEPSPSEDDAGPRNCFVVVATGVGATLHWINYQDREGQQLFSRHRAERLVSHIRANNPKGWQRVAISEIGKAK